MGIIDFQNGGLEHQVFELISKMRDLSTSNEFPLFIQKESNNGKWECELCIPGVKRKAISFGKTEVEAINQCALCMQYILKEDYCKDMFDPDVEYSVFIENISRYFSNINHNLEYRYHFYQTDVLITPGIIELLKYCTKKTIKGINCSKEEID